MGGFAKGSEVPPSERPSRDRGVGPPPRRLTGHGTSWGRGKLEKGLLCLGDTAQQQDVESLSQTAARVAALLRPQVCITYGYYILGAVLWVMQSR